MAYNSSYIYNEQAAWTVDWVNKDFVVAHNISSVESLRIGYVDYTNFTVAWNVITLADAPTVISWGVYVDYFYDTSIQTFDNVNLIYDETTIGEADSSNLVFYSVYPIGRIDELRVWGVAYTSYTVNGRAITLAAAPSSILGAPHIDYYRDDVDVNMVDSGITLSELRSSIYTRIWQTVTSLQYPTALVDEYISEWVVRVSKMKRDKIKRGVFTFRKAFDTTIVSCDGNTINTWTTSGYLPARGLAIVDQWNVVYYSAKSATWISTLTWLELDWVEGSHISFGYKLSLTIEKVSEVFIDWFKLTPCDFAEYMKDSKTNDKFCIYNGYLLLPFLYADWNIVRVVYIGKNTSTYEDTDIIDFNWDYIPVIKSFVMWNIYKDREDDRYVNEYKNYEQLLREYKRELSKQYETTSWVFQYGWPSIG